MQGVYLAEYGLDFVRVCFKLYSGELLFFGIFFAGILLLFTKKKCSAKFFAFYSIFLFLTIFNPIAVNLVFGILGMESVYYRFFWLLPMNIMIAYLFVSIIFGQKKKVLGIFVAILCLGTIVLLGKPVADKSKLVDLPDNLYKVSDEVLEVSELLHQAAENESPRAAVPQGLLMVMRQYDASIILTVKRDYYLGWQGMPDFQWTKSQKDYAEQEMLMKTIYAGDISNPNGFLEALEVTSTEYIIVDRAAGLHEYFVSLGMEYKAETSNYVIYKV